MLLGVNIDHVATLRQVRRGSAPEPCYAAFLCEAAGADSIVAHLREDRRHINEKDVFLLRKTVRTKLNLEMSLAREIVDIACQVKPDQATLVPEKRQELTTEGGLDAVSNFGRIKQASQRLREQNIGVSLFIDPEKPQIDAAVKLGVKMIELHTGRYAESKNSLQQKNNFRQLEIAAAYALKKGMRVFSGHGLDYDNAGKVSRIKGIEELNIGYSIVCRAVLVGLERAVKEMKLSIG
ncbi:MAG: pyridoxine 5'-phosphate synthase [Candidatus Omnitrophota bacterium]